MAIGARFAVLAVSLCSLVVLQCGGTATPDNRNNNGTGSSNNGTGSTTGSGNGTGSNGSGGGGIVVPPSTISPNCGNGKLDSGEDCDDGKNDGGYKECAPQCHYGARCGDGIIQTPYEECDDGKNNGNGSCQVDCKVGILR